MNPNQLLTHFDRISQTPDAIPRLRRFILNLAVRGKLVEQDPRDEPATELLKLVQGEKAQRIKTGHIKKQELLPEVREEEIWLNIPSSWSWVRLETIAQILMGQSPPGDTYNKESDGIPLINGPVEFTEGPFGKTVVNQYTTAPTNVCEEGDLLLCVRGSTTGRTNIAGFRACIGRGVAAIRLFFPDKYVRLFIWLRRESIIEMGRGVAFPSVTRRQIAELPVPLPPLAEQHRIVAKVDELMVLCDRLEAAQTERESQRDRLVASSLNRLNNGTDANTFQDHARFYFNHLPRLTTRTDHIKQLRQTILTLAVQGKLVEQDPKDEPASELLKYIQTEQAKLIKAQVLKRNDGDSRLSEEDLPCNLPQTWQWVALRNIIVFGPQNGISPKPSSRTDAPKAITLTATTSGTFDPHHFKQVEATISLDSEFWLRPGDLLFQRGNTREYVGIAAYYEGDPKIFLYPDLIMKVRLSQKINLRYVHFCAIAPSARDYFSTHASGAQATMPKINQRTLLQLPIPLPPLAEQHRIVAKIDELMTLCNQLETQLTTTQTQTHNLLNSLLTKTLSKQIGKI